MSEGQKREAKRLVEILEEMGTIRKDFHGQYHDQIFIIELHTKEQLIQELANAIAIYQAEALEKIHQKFREANRKAKE